MMREMNSLWNCKKPRDGGGHWQRKNTTKLNNEAMKGRLLGLSTTVLLVCIPCFLPLLLKILQALWFVEMPCGVSEQMAV
eukprot:3064030-Amphidinium_carterae.1